MKKIIVALFVFNTVVGYAQVKLNDYELSIDRNEPLKLLIKAKIHVEDSLSIYPYCPSNKYENGSASFIEIESVYHNGRKIAIGELINASWPILNKNTENKLLDVNYSVDISFIKDQWITGNEQSGININDSYYLVSQALFLFGKKDIESKIKFSIENTGRQLAVFRKIMMILFGT